MLQEHEISVLLTPTGVTNAGVTGGYVDLQGLINPGGRALKVVLLAGPGTTAGTVDGSVQSAEDTSGTGLATLATFGQQSSAGGISTKFGVVPAAHRYVRFLGAVQSGKDMLVAALLEGTARVSP